MHILVNCRSVFFASVCKEILVAQYRRSTETSFPKIHLFGRVEIFGRGTNVAAVK